MAQRLKPLLHKILSPNQTGFLKGRNILHGFHYAQQVIQSAARQRVQIATFKADIYKAFDTISWRFLLNSLEARGFPITWVQCIKSNILQGRSRVILNSVAGRVIQLKRGVRQGDPLSPYLFNLSIDLLSRWIQKLNELNFLIPPFPRCRSCLLYADDTLLFLKPTIDQITKIKLVFDIFGQASGLKINLSKSELSLTSSNPSLLQNLAETIRCKSQTFPIKYLGLPLSDKRLKKTDYYPLIDRIQSALAGWKAPLLSIGGRYILTNAVLTAIPQYYMSSFLLPKWVHQKIDQIRRKFLWHGHKGQQAQARALYMVNWDMATRPRQLGGLGIRNIKIANQALLMKWMWQWHDREQAWWKEATQMQNPSDKPWNDDRGLPFWKNLKHIEPAFNCSVFNILGNGKGIKFWHDNWTGTPYKYLYPNLYQAAHGKHLSIDQCRSESGEWILQFSMLNPTAQAEREEMFDNLQHFQFSHDQDEIKWLRHPTFSAGSAYRFLSHTPTPNTNMKNIWRIKAPLRVMIFAWLLLNNRLTTIDNLAKRGWQLPNMCAMCKRDGENVGHLFNQCIVAKEIRNYLCALPDNQHPITPKFCAENSMHMMLDPKEMKQVQQLEITTCFVLWRERCRRIFSDKEVQPIQLVREIKLEWKNWFGNEIYQ